MSIFQLNPQLVVLFYTLELYKTRNDLNIFKSAELESTFIEIINHEKMNILVGCIYRHPVIDLNEFNDYYLNELLHKLSS